MITIIYWSGTGNTEIMANAVADGAKSCGAEVKVVPVAEADVNLLESDVLLFGCPAMGAEELEEGEFEPFFAEIESGLKGKKSDCSVLMTGATENGCAHGRLARRQTARS